jgi:hypothetical protein
MSKPESSDIKVKERETLAKFRKISWDLDSPNLGTMYDAVGRLASLSTSRLLLPKVLDLASSNDKNVKQAAFTIAGKNAYGKYLSEFFAALKVLNPAEREQVLQGIQEMFSQTGGPTSVQEEKNWIQNLAGLGREHQPAVFELMTNLGTPGVNWVLNQFRENIKNVSLGSIPTLSLFQDSAKKRVIGLLCKKAAKERRDLIPYICGIIESKTQNNLQIFLRKSTWQERVEIAGAVAASGIHTSTGFVMELVADSKWQVKQALLENLKIESSKMNAVFTVLSHLLAETHTRVRTQAEKTLLLLGNTPCEGVSLKEQRKRLEKRFRTQLLKAAQNIKDIDVKWLGIERKKTDPMLEIMEMVSSDNEDVMTDSQASDLPEGVSLSDLSRDSSPTSEEQIGEKEKSILLSALLGAKETATMDEPKPTVTSNDDGLLLDATLPATSKLILVMQKAAEDIGKKIPIDMLLAKCGEAGLSDDEFNKALTELEKQGIVYRPSKNAVSYVDIEL